MARGWVIGGLFAASLAVSALAADPDSANVDYSAERAAIEDFQSLDQRLQDTGWRLARGNAEFCSDTYAATGLQLQDMASYGAPDIARNALSLNRDFAVQTAAKGSPAGASGAFPANREIMTLGNAEPNLWKADDRLDWKRLKRAHDHIDAELSQSGKLTVGFADGEAITLTGVKACATRFELTGDNERAVADGSRVVIGARFSGFAFDDDLFAAAIAHELAHNLLGHREWLDTNGRKRRNIRATEREADKLMPWLLANAGYDPAAAGRFFREYQPNSGGALFLSGSHDKWQKRAKAVDAELPRIRATLQNSNQADWSAHVTRLIDPGKGQ
uniref:hypothetical protein n=1 Tax=uncultured Erythrobacter sp. TaxID=263913 RepID=UPI00261A5D00|nr:hypothetical protein [uncultured Erythrobacter sp.]